MNNIKYCSIKSQNIPNGLELYFYRGGVRKNIPGVMREFKNIFNFTCKADSQAAICLKQYVVISRTYSLTSRSPAVFSIGKRKYKEVIAHFPPHWNYKPGS